MRIVSSAVVITVITVGFACSSAPGEGDTGTNASAVKTYCTKDKVTGHCQCATSDPGINDDSDYVDNCNSPAAGAQCCYDVNGDGETYGCDCRVPLCARDTDTSSCTCAYFARLIVGRNRDNEELVTGTCTSTVCFKGADTCECFSLSNSFIDGEKVESCSSASLPSKRKCSDGQKTASSCSGLKWKAP